MLSHWPCCAWKFFMICFHKILKLISETQPSCPRCTEHCKYMYWTLKKLPSLTAFMEICFYLKNNDSVKRAKSFVNCAIHLFPKWNKVFTLHLIDLVVLNFYVDLVPPFYFWKWNCCFSACEQKFDKYFMSF